MALIGEMQYLTIGGNTYSLPSGGGGSVTSVAVSNATNGGLSVSGSPISSSGTITIGHSNVLSSAQTTQAVYPIKIDKNGHISGYGAAVTIPDISGKVNITETNNGITTDVIRVNSGLELHVSGDYNWTALCVYPGIISLNTEVDSGGYPGISLNKTDREISFHGGTISYLPTGSSYSYTITGTATAERTLTLPNATGTIALTSNIPTVNNATLTIQKNGTTVNSFTANASSNVTANITVPTKVSELTNDSGFIKNHYANDTRIIDIDAEANATQASFVVRATDGLYTTHVGAANDGFWVWDAANEKTYISYSPYNTNPVYITGLDNPTQNTDAANKLYVDNAINGRVPTSRTVNGKALSSNISLTASDVGALPSSTVIPTITDTYSGTSSNGMSGKAVKSAIDALDGSITGTAGAGKTLTAFSQTDGKVTATFGDISITKSQISDFPTIPDVSGKIDTAGTGLSKSGTTLNHSNSVTAQTTQAVYPIKIDAQGHISAYGSAVTIPTNTDTKLQVSEINSNTQYYPIVGTGTTAATRQYDTNGFLYKGITGTTSSVGLATIALGNSTVSGTANNKKGQIQLYGPDDNYLLLEYAGTSNNRTITFPDKAGTVALTSDIPSVSYPVTSVNNKTGAVSLTASDVGALASGTTYVSTVTTTAGAHTAISSKSGAVSFNVPTTAAHVGAATSDHTHGNITNGGDITATAPTIASGDQIIINDNSTSKITNGPTFDGSTITKALTPKGTWETFSNSLLYGECTTGATTAAKTVTVDSSFNLVTGATVAVKFSNINTASSPTLNVNNTGAKAIMRYGTTYAGTIVVTSWNSGSVVNFVYDGTYWQMMDWQSDYNVTQTHSTSNYNYNIGLTNYTNTSTGTTTLNHSSKIKGNPSTGRITTEDLSSSDIDTFVNSLSYSQINAVDYVVEEGTSGSWKYRKWNSGIAECWLQYNPGSYTCGTARGSLYSGGNLTLTYPITFIWYPTVTGNVSLGTDAYVVWLQFNGLGTTTVQCRIVGSASIAANSSYLISVYAIGEWK